MEFHEVANIFPMMNDEEFKALVTDIKAHGLREPVWTYQDKIIDGRNRYKACEEAGIQPQFREWNGQGSLVSFVVSLNLNRRHLSSSQRAMVAIEVEHQLAKENKVGRPSNDGNISVVSGESRSHAASIVGTNSHYVTDAKKIVAQAPELRDIVMNGTMNIADAKMIAKLPEGQRRDVIEQVTELKPAGEMTRSHKAMRAISVAKHVARQAERDKQGSIINGKTEKHVYKPHDIYAPLDCVLYKGGIEELQDKIEPASVDAIITHPSLPAMIDYDALGQFANYALKEGGSLVVVADTSTVRNAYASLDAHLTYHNTLSLCFYVPYNKKHENSAHRIRDHKQLHSPIVWYTKGTTDLYTDKQVIEEYAYMKDRAFSWKQTAIYQLVKLLSKDDHLICDPFDTNGLTLYAATSEEREYIGTATDLHPVWEMVMKAYAMRELVFEDDCIYCEFCKMSHPPYQNKEGRELLVKTTDYDSLPTDKVSYISKYWLTKYEELVPTEKCPYGGYVSLGFRQEIKMKIPDSGLMVLS